MTDNPDGAVRAPARSRRVRLLAGGVVVTAMVVVAAVALVRARSQGSPQCVYQILRERPVLTTIAPSEQVVDDSDPNWDTVRIADWDQDRYWRFVQKGTSIQSTGRATGVMEGVFKPWTEADVTDTYWSEDDPGAKEGYREIVTPTDHWYESARKAERTYCPMRPEWELKRFIPDSFTYYEDGEGGASREALGGPIAKGRLIGEEDQNGEALRVFELAPSEDIPLVRRTLALDSADRIRHLVVTYPADGTVALDLRVWPAPPDQPPIGDPSGQPVMSLP